MKKAMFLIGFICFPIVSTFQLEGDIPKSCRRVKDIPTEIQTVPRVPERMYRSNAIDVKQDEDTTHVKFSGPIDSRIEGQIISTIDLRGLKLEDLLDKGYTHLVIQLDGLVKLTPSSYPYASRFELGNPLFSEPRLQNAVLVQYSDIQGNGQPVSRCRMIPIYDLTESTLRTVAEVAIPIKDLLTEHGLRIAIAMDGVSLIGTITRNPQLTIYIPRGAVQGEIDLTIGNTIHFENRN